METARLRLDYQHDCDSCESCLDFWTGLSKNKDADSDADSGYCSGTARTVEKERIEQPLVVPTIVVIPLTNAEQRAHDACLRETAALRNALMTPYSTSTSSPAYSSPFNSPSSSRRSSVCSSSRVDLAFSNQPHLRPPEESYTRKLKDTWENRVAYPHYFPPLHLYSSRLNASLPSLLPSSSSAGGKVLKGEMVPLSPSILRKRTSRDQIDSVHSVTLRKNNVLVKQRPLSTPIQPSSPSSSSRPASYPPTKSTSTPAPTVGSRRPISTGPSNPVVRKRWSIAGSGVGLNLADTDSSTKENTPPPPTGSKFIEASSSSTTTTTTTPNNKLLKPPPPRNLSQLREAASLKALKNESQDSLSSLGSVLSTTSNTSTALGKSEKGNLSGFRKGWGKLVGRYSTAPSSFKML